MSRPEKVGRFSDQGCGEYQGSNLQAPARAPRCWLFLTAGAKSGGSQTREIDVWKRLIHLAFDIVARDKRTLLDTLATIIEGKEDRAEAELNVNLIEILTRYEALSAVKNRLQVIRNGQSNWERFTQNFTDLYAQNSDLMNLLCDVELGINEQSSVYLYACTHACSALRATVGRGVRG